MGDEGCTTAPLITHPAVGEVSAIHKHGRARDGCRPLGGQAGGMDTWPAFVGAVLERHGVGDVDLARAFGLSDNRFYRRTARESWRAPCARVRVHPMSRPSLQQQVLIACGSTVRPVGAAGEVALWLHGLRRRPPQRATVLVHHAGECGGVPRLATRRARWLQPEDVLLIDQVPTLRLPALLLAVSAVDPARARGVLIDAVQRGLTTPAAVRDRTAVVRAAPGRAALLTLCDRLECLRIESVFQEDVAEELERRGYRPERSTRRISTADEIGLQIDIPLPDWCVAVEPEGDAYHRTREQRRTDRRRVGAFAGTNWVRVPVDWRDWLLDRDHVIAAIDAAIAVQQARGIGIDRPGPGTRRRPS